MKILATLHRFNCQNCLVQSMLQIRGVIRDNLVIIFFVFLYICCDLSLLECFADIFCDRHLNRLMEMVLMMVLDIFYNPH